MREEDHCVNELCQGPTVLLSLQKVLDVFLREKPRSVGQDFVEFSELLQLLWGFGQSIKPLGIAPDLKEVVDM